jgi:hypothetical protein
VAAGVAFLALAAGGGYYVLRNGPSDQKNDLDSKLPTSSKGRGTIDTAVPPRPVSASTTPAILTAPPKTAPPPSNPSQPQTPPERIGGIYAPPPASNGVNATALIKKGSEQASQQDLVGARDSFRRAAEMGSPQAMVLLGTMYASGQGGERDDAEAVHRFQQASDLGYARAMYNLGLMYENHRVPGVPGDDQDHAAGWYEQALKTQKVDEAAFRLGMMFEQGRGRPKNLDEARRLYRLAATPQALSRLANLPPA